MRFSVFSAQLTVLWYRPTNWLAGVSLNIPVNTREYFRLTYFSVICRSIMCYYGSVALCWALAPFSVFWSYTLSVGLLRRGISPSQGLYKHRINALRRGIRPHESRVRSREGGLCLRPRGHCVIVCVVEKMPLIWASKTYSGRLTVFVIPDFSDTKMTGVGTYSLGLIAAHLKVGWEAWAEAYVTFVKATFMEHETRGRAKSV
jgi:hypothetical protein